MKEKEGGGKGKDWKVGKDGEDKEEGRTGGRMKREDHGRKGRWTEGRRECKGREERW